MLGIAQPVTATFERATRAMLRTDETRALLRGSTGSLVLRGVSFGLRFVMGVVLARLLGAAEYGLYAYAVSWLALLAVPTMLGLDHVLLRFVAAYKEQRTWSKLKGLLRFAAAKATIASVAIAGVAVALALTLPGVANTARPVLVITFALLPLVVLGQMRQSALRGLDHPVLAQIPENLIYPAAAIAAAWGVAAFSASGLSATGAAGANAGAWLLAFVVGTLFLTRRLPVDVRRAESATDSAPWVAMMPSLVLTGLTFHLLSRADVLMLGLLATPRDVGVYTAASRGGESVLLFYDAVTLAGASLFSALSTRNNGAELQRFTSLACRLVMWTTLPLYVVLMLFAPWFLALFGAEFAGGVGVMRFLLTTYALSSLSGFVIVMLYIAGHQRDVAIVMSCLAPLTLVLALILIPRFGLMGAAIASGTSLVLLKATLVVVLYRRIGVVSLPYSVRSTVRP